MDIKPPGNYQGPLKAIGGSCMVQVSFYCLYEYNLPSFDAKGPKFAPLENRDNIIPGFDCKNILILKN